MTAPNQEAPTAQKSRKGLSRILHAGGYSLAGLRVGWRETAFRQEALLALVMIPAAFWLGQGWVQVALLAGVVVMVMVVELLNTAVERVVDRVSPEWHELSKHAKDLGSAAVLLSLLLAGGVWLAALWSKFFA
jgi:diacylglycerol kinase (ATP)